MIVRYVDSSQRYFHGTSNKFSVSKTRLINHFIENIHIHAEHISRALLHTNLLIDNIRVRRE